MPTKPNHVPPWDNKRNLESSKPWESIRKMQPTKRVVKRVLSPCTFETTDSQRIKIAGIQPPTKGKKGYEAAVNQLRNVLRENSTVKIYPQKHNEQGELISKVEINRKNVRNLMKQINSDSATKASEGKPAKIRWHRKYLK